MSRDNVVISLDGHTECFLELKPWLPRDCHDAFDAALEEGKRDFAGGNRYFAEMMAAGKQMAWESANDLVELDQKRYHEIMSGPSRLEVTEADGVAAELFIDGFGARTTDPALQHEISMAWCRWFKDYTAHAPYRYTGALAVSLAAGVPTVLAEIATAFDNGIRAIHLPPAPAIADPSLPQFNHSMYEPIWRALNERGMAAIWHASVGREKPTWRWSGTERGWEALLFHDIGVLHQQTLKYFLLAGILERHPDMKMGYIESGSDWIAPILKQIDIYFGAPTVNPAHKLRMSPSEQWARQGFAAGPLDAHEIGQRHAVGVKNLAFGSDYLHTEGTWPTTRKHLRKLLAHLPWEEGWAIVAGNAQRLFGFDIDKLATTPAAQVSWRDTGVTA